MSQRSQRKKDHIDLANKYYLPHPDADFSGINLIRPALPESKISSDSIQTNFFHKIASAPFFIEAMTGGSDASYEINRRLAFCAKKENIAMALGSASILEKEPEQLKSFVIAREINPTGILLANINPLTKPKVADQIVKELQADALQIHLNAVQEAAMTEGDRDFHWLDNILEIQQLVNVPLIIKEVGMGLDPFSVKKLAKLGINYFDVGGMGGTNFVHIENQRTANKDNLFLDDLGLSTVKSLLSNLQEISHVNFIASGGINSSINIFKSLVLGAKYVGIANHFLHLSMQDKNGTALISEIQKLKYQLIILMALFGINKLDDVKKVKYYLSLELTNFLNQI